jgi:hypothetical protein
MKSSAALTVARRRPENIIFGWPHHKHEALATVVGLPQAEQTFARRIELFFLGKHRASPRRQLNPIWAKMFR